ncbi:MAG: hypothetical protein E7649_06210 [Ruminococcaceae bacterium]|nr:hypothetical protein [Oscillospiraceae bacterium]
MLKARIPKAWDDLKPSEQDKLREFAKTIAFEAAEDQFKKDMRRAFDSYIKMACIVLHDAMGFDEEDLMLFLGNHRSTFARQARRVREAEQIEYLNRRMAEIFTKNGFPQEFFDKMFEDDGE